MTTIETRVDDKGHTWFVDEHGEEHFDLEALAWSNPSEGLTQLLVNAHGVLESMVELYSSERYKVDTEWQERWGSGTPDPFSVDSIEYHGDRVQVEASARACTSGCCGYHTVYFDFPLAHLWMDREKIFLEIQDAQAVEAKAKEEKFAAWEADEKARRDRAERREYERLREKFGSLDSAS